MDTGSLNHITPQRPEVAEVYETVLYGACIDALATFYRDVIGLPLIVADPDLMAALPAGTALGVEMPLPSLPAQDRLELAYRSTRALLEVARRRCEPLGEPRQ